MIPYDQQTIHQYTHSFLHCFYMNAMKKTIIYSETDYFKQQFSLPFPMITINMLYIVLQTTSIFSMEQQVGFKECVLFYVYFNFYKTNKCNRQFERNDFLLQFK